MLEWLFKPGKKAGPRASPAGPLPETTSEKIGLALQRHQAGRLGQAEELISRALLRDNSNAPAYSNLGNALAAQGKVREAIDCYQRALALAPDYVDALVNLGGAFRE